MQVDKCDQAVESSKGAEFEDLKAKVSSLSHQINNELFLIDGYAAIALKGLDDTEKLQAVLQKIGVASNRAADAVVEMRETCHLSQPSELCDSDCDRIPLAQEEEGYGF